MKVGLTLPQLQEHPEACIEVAALAERAGIDGVFAFDHLWAIGRPDRPALHGPSLLAALAVETERLVLGTLVARVGLLPDEVLVAALHTLDRISGGRLVAGLGVGDRLSEEENHAYGIAFPPAAARRASLAECCRRLRDLGIESWVGGLSAGTRAVGRAAADALNLWEVTPDEVAAEATRPDAVPVTWGGRVDVSAVDVAAVLRSLALAGATWAVVAPIGAPWTEGVKAVAGAREALP